MISFFRRFFQSKIGLGLTLLFLVLMGFAFASSDVSNSAMFGGVAGGDRVAVVGDRTISTADLTSNVNSSMQQARQDNPTLSMEGFIAQGGLTDVIQSMISRAAIAEFGDMIGLRVGSALVDSEIRSTPALQNAAGEFDVNAFRASLQQRGLSESAVRDDLALSLMARQLLLPIAYEARMPERVARTYAQLLNETRVGRAAVFPASAFAPAGEPTPAQLQDYYDSNRAQYIRPERRTIRYATFSAENLNDIPPVTDAQVAARYRADAALYRERQQRSFTQLVVPTEAAAQAVIAEVRGGTTLEASAQSKGLAVTQVEDVEQQAFAATASQAVAQAAFAGNDGALVGPVRGSLGWYVLRVDGVTRIAARPLAQAQSEIREKLDTERRTQALGELTEELEEQFARGRTLDEAARDLGIEIQTTRPLLASGQVYGAQEQAPAELGRVLNFAFEVPEGQANLDEAGNGEVFLIYDVATITRSATAPLAEIRDTVIQQWRRDRGMAAAGQAAGRVMQRVEGGASLADAVAQETASLPATQALRISRRQLQELGQVTRATILFFSMAEGTVERVAVQEQNQWFVVALEDIEVPQLAANDQLVEATRTQLSQSLGNEYVEQFVAAVENAVDVERNDAGIDAVRQSLLGANNPALN
ncbi:peptidylprolyl isomerase [Erythrobacter arachoides]|uniref:Parvulin-like PPIase n=1 Tax=Aurantiacibacter arachoides TaxID=1850444 RepID=A0A845A1U5_9SPHN|nr:peptidyl-prolyl cis-trans isomerase [Aurantiacibacter arachoides]MXO93106.1 peptidylprolyl isomerase [Aurantiacibacter arachoides]GGD51992.1 hypothetical protein GCM10011411_09790 [Aurantiacibacter arachoides]